MTVAGAAHRRGNGLCWWRDSVIGRLSLCFGGGTLLILVLLGSMLVVMIRHQIEWRDAVELASKTQAVTQVIQGLDAPEEITTALHSLEDLGVGHQNLELGLFQAGRWLMRPGPALVEAVERGAFGDAAAAAEGFSADGRHWRVRWIEPAAAGGASAPIAALVALDVTMSDTLIAHVAAAVIGVGIIGAVLIGLLTWWAASRALAPLARVADEARRVTAQDLGQALAVEDAPLEVRGLVAAINQMLERLRRSFASLEQFSADIAHELRTPVTALMTQTQVTLARERSAPEYREALHHGLEELQRLQRMVTDMLFIARAERGVNRALREPATLARIAHEVTEYFELAASEKDQEIKVHGALVAACDPLMIRRALTNLLSNAVRYAPPATSIDVRLSSQGTLASIEVDSACPPGFSEARIEDLFERFVRDQNLHGVPAQGLGLGLAIVRSIMRLHGGGASGVVAGGRIVFSLRWPLAQAEGTAMLIGD